MGEVPSTVKPATMTWLNRARRLYLTAGDYIYLLRKERRVDNPPALGKRIDALRRGFSSNKAWYYDFEKYDPSLYVSDIQTRQARVLNTRHGVLLSSKIGFEHLLPAGVLTPKNFAWLYAGKLRSLVEEWRGTSLDDLLAGRNGQDKLVLKPVWGEGGRGILVMHFKDQSIILNNKTISFEEARARIAKLNDYLITAFVEQDDFPSSIFPGAVNTMRFLTISDPDTDEPFIAAAAHRFGNRASAPVDNLVAGGMSSLIDLESGTLSAAAERAKHGLIMHDVHPDTGVQIRGRAVPNWAALKQHVLEVANQLPFICHVGWDIALTAKGPMFIEVNLRPNPRPFQLHRPLLLDPRIKRFYEKRGII
jgi:Sugar-transfer associated ATP-grasp